MSVDHVVIPGLYTFLRSFDDELDQGAKKGVARDGCESPVRDVIRVLHSHYGSTIIPAQIEVRLGVRDVVHVVVVLIIGDTSTRRKPVLDRGDALHVHVSVDTPVHVNDEVPPQVGAHDGDGEGAIDILHGSLVVSVDKHICILIVMESVC